MSDDTPAKDPLAVLEELLAKQQQGGVGAAPAGPDPAVIAKEAELAARQAEYERLQAEAATRDAQLLAEQEEKMKEVTASPQYQARVDQNAAVKQEIQQTSDEQEGYEIRQVSTTRVPVQLSENQAK